jgi:hypothetical protein
MATPAVVAETLHDPRPSQRLQATHMAVHEGVRVRAPREVHIAKVDQLAMVGRPILAKAIRQPRNGPVGRTQIGFSAAWTMLPMRASLAMSISPIST